MQENTLTPMLNVSWCLERDPPPVPTCPPAPDFGALLLEERSMGVRHNTCPGLMVHHVVMTSGVSDHNVSPNTRLSVSWMGGGVEVGEGSDHTCWLSVTCM